jgi:hypothetical protein
MSILCVINFTVGRETLSDTARTVFLVASWTFAGLWAEATARRRSIAAPAPDAAKGKP